MEKLNNLVEITQFSCENTDSERAILPIPASWHPMLYYPFPSEPQTVKVDGSHGLNITEAEPQGGYFSLGHSNQQNKSNFNWVKMGKTCISKLWEHILGRFTHTHRHRHTHKNSELWTLNH